MKLWMMFVVLLAATHVSTHEHEEIDHQLREEQEAACKDYCKHGGRCHFKDDMKHCECYDVQVATAIGNVSASFHGDRCQDNFHICFYETARDKCLKDLAAVYHQFEERLSHKKYKSSCKQLDRVIKCLGDTMNGCSHLTKNSLQQYQDRLGTWTKSQAKYCVQEKYAWGDDCCNRKCNKFDPERLCQCNNACRWFGDCCYDKNKLCKRRDAKKGSFVSSAPEDKCDRINGTVCQKVQEKANATMLDVIEFMKELELFNINLIETVNKTLQPIAAEHNDFPKFTPNHKNKASEIEKLMKAYKPIPKTMAQVFPDEVFCGNCTRSSCANPCPTCLCKAYNNAICRPDACVLAPCDASLPCVPRWYVVRNGEYLEVTLSCRDDEPDHCIEMPKVEEEE